MKVPEKIHGWTAASAGAQLQETAFSTPDLGPWQAVIRVLHCGVCHSDLHLIQDDWKISTYPLVPGHEIVGEVVALGAMATHLRVGQTVGVGWQRGSCGLCEECASGRDNMCSAQAATCVGHPGGYADFHVTDSRYAFPLPQELRGPDAAPLLCGGITVYSPLAEFVTKKNARVGVVGLGGLGHLAVKMAHAMGHHVVAFSSTPGKRGDFEFVDSRSAEAIGAVSRKLDLVLVTANVDLPWEAYLSTLRADGTLCFVGIPPSPLQIPVGAMLGKRLRVTASPIGSRARIQEMLEFCARNGVRAQVEVFPMQKVNEVLPLVKENRVRFRAVLSR